MTNIHIMASQINIVVCMHVYTSILYDVHMYCMPLNTIMQWSATGFIFISCWLQSVGFYVISNKGRHQKKLLFRNNIKEVG